MGTSKGYLPPTGYLWSDVKRDVTKMVKDNFTDSSVEKTVSNFAKVLNSSRSSGGNAGQAIQSGKKVLGFIDAVRQYGFDGALEQAGLAHLKGRPTENIKEGLLKYFNDGGNEFYNSISNQTMNELLREILKGVKDSTEYEDVLKSIDASEFIMEFIIKFIQNCFFANFTEKLLTLFESLGKYDIAERSVKTFIRNSIEAKYSKQQIQSIDWNGVEGNRIINEMYNKSLNILSKWGEING
ncbi:hypothetical protein ACQKM9_13900 [Viridibacillus sp. NPDC093762]|uniref:hypothetical protein n=1 Tax=Viridibacillus sp. NPDC093762 TaxID=3390720 RepID=UPI003CFC53DC